VNCLIVGSHCSELTSSLPQTRFPLLTLRQFHESAFEQRCQPVEELLSCARQECLTRLPFEKSGVRVGRAFLPARILQQAATRSAAFWPRRKCGPGVGRSVQSETPRAPVGQPESNWTTGPVHTDRTDTPNLVKVVSDCRQRSAGTACLTARQNRSKCSFYSACDSNGQELEGTPQTLEQSSPPDDVEIAG